MYLRLDPHNGVPLGVQIAAGLRVAIATRRLAPGERLPSARELAAELHVNFHTVRKAYGDLEAEGLVELRRGLGAFVAASRQARAAELRRIVRAHVERLVEDTAGIEMDPEHLLRLVQDELQRLATTKKKTS